MPIFAPGRPSFPLFPLDGAAGLGGEVVQHAVDAGHLFGDAVGDVLEQGEGHVLDGGGHRVFGVDGADDDGVGEGALAVFDADRLEVGHDGEVLPDLALQPVFGELLAQDGVRLAHTFQPLARDRAQAAHAQAGAGEGLAVDHTVGQAERLADDAHFVFIEEFEGLDQLELQIFGQAAHVVVRLDGAALQNVRIDGALRQKFDAVLLARLLLEHADELRADDLALGFGVGDARELVQKAVDGVDVDEVGVHLAAEHLDHLFGLPFAQQAVVDVHADEVLADRLDEQRRHDGRIDPARQREQHLFAAHLAAHRRDLLVDERLRLRRALDARHVFGALVAFHKTIPPWVSARARRALYAASIAHFCGKFYTFAKKVPRRPHFLKKSPRRRALLAARRTHGGPRLRLPFFKKRKNRPAKGAAKDLLPLDKA